jgi:RND family efflux transporter MFP subunit
MVRLGLSRLALLLLPLMAAVVGCRHAGPAPASGGALEVAVAHPLQQDVIDYQEFTGRTMAVDSVQVRARVSGYLDDIYFKDGSEVDAGTVLGLIDPRPYQFALAQAKAQVSLQEATLRYQESVYRRNMQLYGERSEAQETVEQSRSQRDQARANLAAATAARDQAQLNLQWTQVQAPISGRASRTLVTPGNLIIADQTLLTTIVSQDPMDVYFDVDEATVLKVQQLIREGRFPSILQKPPPGEAPSGPPRGLVHLQLTGEKDFPHEGYLDFINNQLDPSTATLQIRGVFSNARPAYGPRLLTPGLFVRIRTPVSGSYNALLVDQAAIGTDQDVTFVYLLDEQNQVRRKDVKLGTQHNNLVVVAEGVGPDDRVVVDGLQHVRQGMTVRPRLVPMPERQQEATQPPRVMRQPAGSARPKS